MNKYLILLTAICLSLCTYAQIIPAQNDTTTDIFTSVEQMPQFPGGEDALLKYLAKNIQYPEDARDCECQGTIFITFVIDEVGNVTQPSLLRGIKCDGTLYIYPNGKVKKDKPGKGATEWDCNKGPKLIYQEAVRVIKAMPKWKPGIQDGKPVKVQYNLPIKFTLR